MSYEFLHKSILGKILRKIYRRTSPKKYLESLGNAYMGYKFSIDNPKTFNEKMAWLKLYDHNPLYHRMVDKYEVKSIVEEKLGKGYTAKCYGIWERFSDVDFDITPPYVVKSTHYGIPIIIKTKADLDINHIKRVLKSQSKTSGYKGSLEWSYKDVKPRIMMEEYLEDDSDNTVLQDYKFWCFNGEPKILYLTVKNDNVYENFYDMDFNVIDINHGFPRRKPEFEKPSNFDEMKRVVKVLADGIPFVRVDLYNIRGKIYFGEYTFYDWGGTHPFSSYKQDLEIGSWLELPSDFH